MPQDGREGTFKYLCVQVYVYIGACEYESQERTLGTMKLDLQMVVNWDSNSGPLKEQNT